MENSNSRVKRLLNETICPVCGRIFYRPDASEWVYYYYDKKSNSKKSTCSYSCNKVAQEKLARKRKRRNAKAWEQY